MAAVSHLQKVYTLPLKNPQKVKSAPNCRYKPAVINHNACMATTALTVISSIRRQNLVDILTISAAKHISWQLVWAKKHISTPMQYCSLSSFIWKMDNATKFGISMTLIGNIKSFELSLMLPSLISIIRKLDFYSNWSGSSNTRRLPACCMNQDIHNLVTQKK